MALAAAGSEAFLSYLFLSYFMALFLFGFLFFLPRNGQLEGASCSSPWQGIECCPKGGECRDSSHHSCPSLMEERPKPPFCSLLGSQVENSNGLEVSELPVPGVWMLGWRKWQHRGEMQGRKQGWGRESLFQVPVCSKMWVLLSQISKSGNPLGKSSPKSVPG